MAMRIPKIIHRVWIHDPSPEKDPMPEEFKGYGREWKRMHPAWDVVDHFDLSDLVPMRNQAMHDAAKEGDYRRYRADIVRLEILWKYGGVYVDTDCEPLKPLDDLLDDVDAFVGESANQGPNGERIITNAVMGAVPGHPFVDAAIRRLPESAREFAGKPTAIVVGPWHLQRTLEAGFGAGLTVFPPYVFFPQSNRDRNAGKSPDLSRSYAWHRWANTRKMVEEKRRARR